MRLWTIQTEPAYHHLLETERLTGDWNRVDSDFVEPYRWLTDQMKQRIVPGCPTDGSPIWAWQQHESKSKPRPDLRQTGHLPGGTIGYRIELQVDPAECLLSDFELWHYVLNYWYLPESQQAQESFEQRTGDAMYAWDKRAPGELDREIHDSWQRIFDLLWHDPYYTHPPDKRSVQATLWELRLSQVARVDRFVAR